ncbi:LysR family transcriptional regulator [Kribbella lupini]|uniref:LysR family transcriptional regulator n=1 Tax=Kribbella lupini TaxID=291602 RepID=UPI0031D71E20
MDLEAVRTFVTATDVGQFQAAADELRITQQAVSKRIAALERELGVLLFTRSPRGARLSVEGETFLPHARELLRVAQQAEASVRPVRRALRIDVLNRRTAPAAALHAFHRLHPEIELDIVELPDATVDEATKAVAEGAIDATFRYPRHRVPTPARAERVIDDRHQLLVGPRHPLASAARLTLAELAEYPVWMPGLPADSEWGSYYAALAATFGLEIVTTGPSFGIEVQLDELTASADLATLVGEGTRYLWPEAYGLRRIPIVKPIPVYPHSLIWRDDNPHPGLAIFLDHLRTARAAVAAERTWVPA